MDITQQLIEERDRRNREKSAGYQSVNAAIAAKNQELQDELDRETQSALTATNVQAGGPDQSRYDYRSLVAEGRGLTAGASAGDDGPRGVVLPNRHIMEDGQHLAGRDVATGAPVSSSFSDAEGYIASGLEKYRNSAVDTVQGHPVDDIAALNRVAFGIAREGGSYGDFAAQLPDTISDAHVRLAWRAAQRVETRQELEQMFAELPDDAVPAEDPEALYFSQKIAPEALPFIPGYLDAARTVYRHWEGKEFEGSDQQLADFGLELISMFNTNFTIQGALTTRAMHGPQAFKQALYDLMVVDDNTAMTWGHFGRGVLGLATDPTTYMTLGVGKLAAKAPARLLVQRMLRASLAAGTAAGVEGGVATTVDDYFRQRVEQEAGMREGIDPGRLATAGAVGTVAGAAFGATLGAGAEAAGPAVKWAGRQISDARARYREDPAGALFPQALGGVEGRVGRDIQADAGRAERKIVTGQKLDNSDVDAIMANPIPEQRGPIQRSPERVRDNLRKHVNRAPGTGAPKNRPRVVKGKDGQDIPIGPVTRDDWANRVERVLSDDDIAKAGRWYGEIRDTFRDHFGDEGDLYMTAWLMSNQNVDPPGAMMNALRVSEQVASGAVGKRGGLSHDAVQALFEGNPTAKGMGPKLFDFIDSALGKAGRTWMGDTAAGGHPVVVDVWTARDMGYLDDVQMRWLKDQAENPRQVARLQHDFAPKGTGSVTETQYEWAADHLRNLTDELNASRWKGRSDWRPHEIQAIGWTAMGKDRGAQAFDTLQSIRRNQRQISYELDFGEGAPMAERFPQLADLPYKQKMAVTQDVLEEAHRIATEIIQPAGGIQFYGPGGWGQWMNPSGQTKLTASKEAAIDYADIVGYLAQQTEMFVTRVNPKGRQKAVDLYSDKFADPDFMADFWRRLGEIDERFTTGFHPVTDPDTGGAGIRIVRTKGGKREEELIRGPMAKAIEKVANDMDVDLTASVTGVETVVRGNNWKENPDGKGYMEAIKARYGDEAAGALDRVHAPAIESRIAAALEAQGPVSPQRQAGYDE